MKGTSKVIMGATLVMVVTLAVVIALILVLLAELYCSLLLRRRQLRKTNSNNTIPISTTTETATNISPSSHAPHAQQQRHSPPSPPPPQTFTNIYSQGVLQAPRSFLYPCKNESKASPRGIGLVSLSSSSPLASFLARAPPQVQQDTFQVQGRRANDNEILCVDNKSCGGGEHLVYICNPIYENEEEGKTNTPFETPHTSPSCLEKSGSSGNDDHDDDDYDDDVHEDDHSPHPPIRVTPPLTPMKKLPAEASSVSLRDATSLGTSGSDSHSINCPSSSSSDSPCTSPSW